MAITEEELKKLIGVKADVEKVTSLSSDGRNLLTRIPKEIREHLRLEKGDKLRWLINSKKQIKVEIVNKNAGQKKESSRRN